MPVKHYILPLLLLPLFFSCSTTKYVPEKQYLLNKVTIKTDNKSVSSSDLENYVQQKPNKDFLFLKKSSLKIYSLSGRDTTKRRNRFLRKLGAPPVIYSIRSMKETEKQLTQRMQNLGYLNAEVRADTILKKKKANIIYHVRSNKSYTIRNYEIGIADTAILSILASPRLKKSLKIQSGIRFVPEDLGQELQTLTNSMRNRGYYNLSEENFYFLVDSSLKSNQVDVKLMIRNTWENQEDSIRYNSAFKRYRINSVTLISGYDQFDPESRRDFIRPDTVDYQGLKIIYGSHRFVRKEALYKNCFIRPGRYYSDRLLENTYSSMNSMSAVKQVNIYFREVNPKDTSLLNAFIMVAPSNIFYQQIGFDGTNSAGDLGVAGYVIFQDQNIFNGSETFRVKLNGGIESITSSGLDLLSDNYYQYGADFSLIFPRFLLPVIPKRFREQTNAKTIFKLGINWQNRREYDQRFVDIDWTYRWSTLRNRLNHTLDVYNVNYIVTPWTSDPFKAYLDMPDNAFLKESYTDRFITRSSYSIVYTSLPPSRAQNEGYTIRTGIDVAGTLPYLISRISGGKTADGAYGLFGNPFAQYVKVSADYACFFTLNSKNIIALHAGLGIASPYLNSSIIPYEQRYFAGGPNSVRGWNTRTLGPGTYKSGGNNDFINQNGDIKILLNMEYRLKTETFLEYALFADAGNVWTIRHYDSQQGGAFKWDSCWNEMGLSWGIGVRPNFGFILIRMDLGMKIYSPEPLNDIHWVIAQPNLSRDLTFHFAIGYPF